ncbi:MAG: sodium:proton antiporter [Candidatus Eremiobacteraeota bacterium]|nr:sodium:proton antiporter [Candidatus Eremiobacteraeota bacterium]
MIAQLGHPFAIGVLVFVVLLAGALVVGVLAERVRIPYAVALVAAGVAISLNRNEAPFDFGAGLLFFFLPALLFEAAWGLSLDALRRTWRTIAWLAVPGVVVTVVIVAGVLDSFGPMVWSSAFIAGAIVSATDPVAVIAIFRRVNIPLDLQTIVEGESLANDAVASVLVLGLVGFAEGAGSGSVAALAARSLVASAGGIVLGIACAYAVALLVRGTVNLEMKTIGTVLVAYGAYILADALHLSGIFATISAGVALRALLGATNDTADTVGTFWGVVAFLANSLVFLLMGLTMHVERLLGEPLFVVGAIFAALLSRVVVAYGIPPFKELRGHARWHHVIALAGMRGGLAVALALSLPADIHQRTPIVDAVFAIVLFTTLVQGLAIGPVVERLGPNGATAEA